MNKYYVGEGKEYPTYNRKKANWVGHIFCTNCLLKHVTEGKIETKIEVYINYKFIIIVVFCTS